VEERHSWLPPGLESSGVEPDDRAAQRAQRKRDKRSEEDSRPEPQRDPQSQSQQQQAGNGQRKRNWKREKEPSGEEQPGENRTREDRPPEKQAQQDRPRERGEKHGEQGDRQPVARERPRGDHQPSDVDAMGQDKHRQVIGQRYGASRGRQLLYYGIFIAFLVFSYIGLSAAVSHFDKKPAHNPDAAPWSKRGAPQGPLGGFEPSKAHQRGPTHFQ
jgi:hypothetical protein